MYPSVLKKKNKDNTGTSVFTNKLCQNLLDFTMLSSYLTIQHGNGECYKEGNTGRTQRKCTYLESGSEKLPEGSDT